MCRLEAADNVAGLLQEFEPALQTEEGGRMKSITIAVFLISVSVTLNAQSLGTLAKAERQRQHNSEAVQVLKEINASPEPEHAAQPEEPPKDPHTVERAELEREKATLLLKLNEVIHDRKAVQEIQERLAEIQKRTNELKQDNAAPKAEPKATETKTDPKQK